MLNWIINLFKKWGWIKNTPPIMENLSTLATDPLMSSFKFDLTSTPIDAKTEQSEVSLTGYIFNLESNNLEKVKISFNFNLIDIIAVSPWGVIGMNSNYELVNLKFLDSKYYIMNTKEFNCTVSLNGVNLNIEHKEIENYQQIPITHINSVKECLKDKNISYPVFNEQYISHNQRFFNEEELLKLFSSFTSQPINDLMIV